VPASKNAQRGYRYNRKRRESGAPKRLSLHSCDICGKQCFESEHMAKLSYRRSLPGAQLRTYLCGGFWHVTSVPADRMAMYREMDYRRAQDA
jgi:hypothetical protein